MSKKAAQIEFDRLKNLLIKDKANAPCQLADVLKSDIYTLMKNYMEINSENIKIYFDADEKGYHIIISVHTNRFKQMGMLPKYYERQ